MKLQDQVPSRELCEKLKKLGYPQEGWFWWDMTGMECDIKLFFEHLCSLHALRENDPRSNGSIVAPTVAEMGELLKGRTNLVSYDDFQGFWRVCLSEIKADSDEGGDTEADARAQCLIYLAEKKLIKFK